MVATAFTTTFPIAVRSATTAFTTICPIAVPTPRCCWAVAADRQRWLLPLQLLQFDYGRSFRLYNTFTTTHLQRMPEGVR